ncbi:energy transducer TonB [Flagellimonas nanhaiensis]|uniref:Energy transducer TonB n=1 Tax=Flagellimonas nanhaiensis TaxID=2292706 RepID=A0A371JNM9_9FLAO|nr:energy transducer TonB [Allomuricauda nanhaiensis]RDY58833.1 energy transducer TonB [Allomuricauda nanhaiensis]
METKKYREFELKKNSALYFSVGLMAVLLLAYVALEWKTYDSINEWDHASLAIEDDLIENVPITKIELPKPKIIQAPPIIEIVDDDSNKPEDIIKIPEPEPDTEVIPIEKIAVADIDEPEVIPWILVEDAPIFPGCENANNQKACFQQMMQKHIRKHFEYPEMAQEMGLQGRVNIMFTIQKDGSISEVRMRGPHEVLEKEAKRIISKLPKMTPGKQRGTPVKVPFSIPITFKLQ